MLIVFATQIVESRHTEPSNFDQRGSYSPVLDFLPQAVFIFGFCLFFFSVRVLDLIRVGRTEQSERKHRLMGSCYLLEFQ